jgi:hypothetical protein
MKKLISSLAVAAFVATMSAFADTGEVTIYKTNTVDGIDFLTKWTYTTNATPRIATLISAENVVGDVTIPNLLSDGSNVWSVTKVGNGALANNPGLLNITVPNSILEVGAYVFSNCTALAEVTLNYGIRYIGERAFVNTAVREINIPDSIIDMGGNISAGTLFTSTIIIGDSSHFKYSDDGVLYNRDMTKLYSCPTRAEGTVTIPNTVTNIAADAFFGCHRLSYLNLPATVSTIGNGAFNVSGIWPGLSAPESTPKLLSVFYNGPQPNAPDDIYTGAPADLVSYALDEDWDGVTTWKGREVKSIDNANPPTLAYVDATGITWFYRIVNGEAEIYNEDAGGNPTTAVSPASTSGIAYKEKQDEETTITRKALKIPESINGFAVTKIGPHAFDGCAALTRVGIPDSIREIGDYAFRGCTAITSIGAADYVPFNVADNAVTLPTGITKLGYHPFDGLKVSYVSLPYTISALDGNPVAGCAYVTSLTIDSSCPSYYSDGNILYNKRKDAVVAVPANYDGSSVSFLGSVTTIGGEAMLGCKNVSQVQIPDALTAIGVRAFAGCESIRSLSLPNTLATIGAAAFSGCTSLTTVSYDGDAPDAADDIYNGTQDALASYISDTATGFTTDRWKDRNVVVVSSGEAPGGDAELGQLVGNVTWYFRVVDGVAEIWRDGATAVSSADPIMNLTLPSTLGGYMVKGIGDGALSNLRGITTVSIPGTYEWIGDGAFTNCTSLLSVSLANGLRSIGRHPFEGTAIETIAIPDTVTSIDGNILYGCLPSVSLSVGDNNPYFAESAEGALYDKDFENLLAVPMTAEALDIPASVTNIADEAFAGCTRMKSLVFEGDAPAAADDVFADTPASLKITVQDGSLGWDGDPASSALPASGLWRDRQIVADVEPPVVDSNTDGTWVWVVDSGVATLFNDGESALLNTNFVGAVSVPSEVTDSATGNKYVVAGLGPRALYGCSFVTGVSLPSTLKSIGAEAFSGTLISTLHIPAFVEAIYGNPAAGCARFTGFTVDEENIDFAADEAGILYDYFGEELIGVPARARTVTIPESVVLVWADAFASCKSLTNATYRCNAPQLESDDIYADTSATKFTTYAAVGTTGWDGSSTTNMPAAGLWPTTGANGRPIVSLYKPDGESDTPAEDILSETDSSGITWYYRVDEDGVAEIWRNGETAVTTENPPIMSITLPTTLGGYVVKGLGDGALSNLRGITGVAIPNTYEWIGAFAFSNCTSLASANLGDGIVEIGRWPFYGTKITELTIPDSAEKIDGNPIAGASLARQVIVSDNQPYFTVVDGVLYDKDAETMLACPATKDTISVPETMKEIAPDALEGCHVRFGGEATDGDITWTYDIVDGKAVITDASGTSPSVTIPNTLGGAPVAEIELDALNKLTSVSNFVSLSDAYTTRNGVLYSADGTRLIRVPNEMTLPYAIVTEASTTRVSVTTVPGVQIINGQGVDLTTVTTNTSFAAHTVTTNLVDGDISFDQLLTNVVIIDDYAFAGCNIFTNTYVATTNSTGGGGTGYTSSGKPYVVEVKDLSAESVTYITTLPLPGSVMSVGPNALADSGVTVEGDLPRVEIGDYPYSITVESYSADAATALVKELLPLDSPFPSIVDDSTYRDYFSASTTPAGDGSYEVKVELDGAAIGYSQSVSDMASAISAVASGNTDETTISVKPGLYYAIAATSALNKPYTIVDCRLATGSTLTLKMTRPSTQSGYYKLLVGVREITSCE